LFSVISKLKMTLAEFRATLAFEEPPSVSVPLLIALWYDAKGDWDKAHEVAQSIHTARGSWVHAYLHRKEGDMSNASYWYARAGRDLPMIRLDEEWDKLAAVLLAIC
jgi:hypothetical protein